MSKLYETLFRKVLFPVYESGLRQRKTLHYLREYERNQWLDPEQLQALQWKKLKQLIAHCWNEVPYYRERWQQLGATPDDIRNLQDYARLPVLTKPEIRANFERMIAPGLRKELLYKTTGGSTGEPLRFGYTRESYERRVAVMFRGYGWSGARMGQRTLYLWGVPSGRGKLKDHLHQVAFHRHTLSAFSMSESRMAWYADAVDAYKPEVIVSYVAPIVKLAEWLLANGRRIHRPGLVLGAAESLHESQRQVIEQAFGCPAYNTYGCREFMLIAAECDHRNGLHVNADHLVVELGNTLSPEQTDGARDVIVTDLHNYGMPMLRYVNGDLARAHDKACTCGRGLPLLSSVDGRKLDALRTPDGRFVPGEFIVCAFLSVPGIKRYQVVQRELGALDVVMVRGEDFDVSVVEPLIAELRNGLGADMAIRIHYADDIPLTLTGKHRVTISELA
ncbi:MAG: phenylacetate--CoA ligase family protein [Luteimonas sp.]